MLKLKKTITEHINNDYRNYAIYSLESRGIPDFYDSLTTVQRFIVQEAPFSFTRTLSLSGKCISSGYHHGNSSIENAINNLTRDFLCSNKILDGDGFFGNSINPDASSARYTSVKINKDTKEILKKYDVLNEKDGNSESWKPLKMEIPIGLCVNTNGIAVGYACSILPRKIEHIQEYLEGTRKSLKPVLLNFSGKILKNSGNTSRSSWILEPKLEANHEKKRIHILEISPTINYSSYLNKLNPIIEKYNCKAVNNSRDSINIELIFSKDMKNSEFTTIHNEILKISTSTVTENIVLIKDGSVLEYDSVEDYLDDFKNYREFLFLEKLKFDLVDNENGLAFLNAKKEYLEFMMAKKRLNHEIEEFLSKYSKEINLKLDTIKLRTLNPESVIEVQKQITDIRKVIKEYLVKIDKQTKTCNKIENIITKAKTSKIAI